MSYTRKQVSRFAVAALLSLGTAGSFAAENDVLEEVVVTGSFIRGTPEDAALPVDVFNRAELEDVGNPSVIELVRNLGVTSGNLGETNQFQDGGQANEGVATVNLRGLGAARTLVLINGRRHVGTEVVGVDISAIPTIAIGRLEVLKDGAAATYGSDAIGGVVNFITRENFEGFEVRASHQNIQDSDGDNSIGAIAGFRSGDLHVALSAEYEKRNELRIRDRDWALRPVEENPEGGWSNIGNPPRFLPAFGPSPANLLGAGGPDPQCELLGGSLAFLPSNQPNCRFQYTYFDNLIEETENTRFFGELNYDINDYTSLHLEALWAEMDMPAWKTSPSYPPQSLFGPDRFIPATHPGLADLKAQNPGLFTQVGPFPPEAQGAFVVGRMLGVAGRPGGVPESAPRNTETARFAAALDGSFQNGITYNIAASWSQRERYNGGSDMYIERMGFALDGLGGPNCDQATGTPGQGGCEYYNPFSNAIEVSAVNGVSNPQYNPAVANSDELIDWLTAKPWSFATNELFVLDAVFSGETDIQLAGGNIGWAAGVQSRSEDYTFELSDISNRAVNPCPFVNPVSVTLGHTASLDCSVQTGRLAFLAATDEESTSRDIYGAFAEFSLPVTSDLNVQLAFRYEDYEDVGSTFDPKIAFRWQASDVFTLRGSASTTFRGPPQSFLSGTNTELTYIDSASAFKAVDVNGNPNLSEEQAVALNLGAIVQTEAFYGSVDFWSFDFKDPFQTESEAQIVEGYIANDCADGGTGVGTPACDALRSHIFPAGIPAAGLQRVEVNILNGSDIQTSGFDVNARYDFFDVAGGTLTLGGRGTYVLEFESDDFVDVNGYTLAPGGDFAGLLNDGDPFTPKPELQANLFAKWSTNEHRVNYDMRYVSSYDDVRPSLPELGSIDSHVTHDVHYINNMFDNLTLSLSVINLTDEDPPLASTDLSYDAFTHSAFGRMIKVGLTWNLDAL